MRGLLSAILFPVGAVSITLPAGAEALSAPEISGAAKEWMPETMDSFGKSLESMLLKLLPAFRQELPEAFRVGIGVFSCVLLISILKATGEKRSPAELAGAVCISAILLKKSQTMFSLAADTVTEIGEYQKLFLPVLTAASAAQGKLSASAALYIGTSAFTAFLSSILRGLMFPVVGFFLAVSIAHCAVGENMLKQIKEQLKKLAVWFLKTVLTVFFTYMSITGAVTGSADRAAVKTAKAAISAAVPVIGGSLAEASEALLISAEVAKNAIGIYGILACTAIFLSPFVRIGSQYLVLKTAAALCAIVDSKRLSDLVNDFCTALGLLLAMAGTITVLSIIGAVSFLKIA